MSHLGMRRFASTLLRPCTAIAAFTLGIVTASTPKVSQAAPREIVVAHEVLLEAGDKLEANLAAFLRRVEEVAGLPKNGLKGKAFARPADALAYIREQKVGFAILPAHQVAEAHKTLKLEILGRAVGIDGRVLQFVTVTRKPRPFPEGEIPAGARVAASETHDPAWLALLTEGDLDPRSRPLALVQTPSSQAALDALLAKKADLAILHPQHFQDIKRRIEDGGDLEWVVTSPKLPPSAFVAVGKFASAQDRKRMAAAIDKVCKTSGADACGRMGLMYIEAGRADSYADVINGYQSRVR
ncbi:MAG TPA: PhnD/SsuA/transferrin family substrate-binding protein [Polyangia bacterium]